jgi:hypothetical protein
MIIQDQVLLGTVLGGSSLLKHPNGVNFYLSMRGQNESWLLYKTHEMRDLFNGMKTGWYTNTFRVNSHCLERLTSLHDIMYVENRRRITMEILNPIRDHGLAIWYLDSGSKTGRSRKNAYINTTKFGEDGSAIVEQFFNEVDMPCRINRDGTRMRVLFTIEGTKELFRVIEPCVPEFMLNHL